jgi:hypothetical protein
MAIELWPAILTSVHTSQPLSPRRVKKVWRSPYSTKGRTPETFNVLACCFLRVEGSMCPLLVGVSHTQPSAGLKLVARVSSGIYCAPAQKLLMQIWAEIHSRAAHLSILQLSHPPLDLHVLKKRSEKSCIDLFFVVSCLPPKPRCT